MLDMVYKTFPYGILVNPNIKIKRPTWIRQPAPMTVFALILLSYFLVTGGAYAGVFLVCIARLLFVLGVSSVSLLLIMFSFTLSVDMLTVDWLI